MRGEITSFGIAIIDDHDPRKAVREFLAAEGYRAFGVVTHGVPVNFRHGNHLVAFTGAVRIIDLPAFSGPDGIPSAGSITFTRGDAPGTPDRWKDMRLDLDPVWDAELRRIVSAPIVQFRGMMRKHRATGGIRLSWQLWVVLIGTIIGLVVLLWCLANP